MRTVLIVTLLLPLRVIAWEDHVVLVFINQVNPIIQAQRRATLTYAKPDTVTWALRNTSVNARLGYGGTDLRDAPYTVFGGLQFNIPLSSIKEDREQAVKKVAEVKAIETIHAKVIADITRLRSMESELTASEVRRTFLKEKASWLKDRINEGYSSEMEALWTMGAKVNIEDALIAKIDVQLKTQRYKLARYAGEHWRRLEAYLLGQEQALGGIDG